MLNNVFNVAINVTTIIIRRVATMFFFCLSVQRSGMSTVLIPLPHFDFCSNNFVVGNKMCRIPPPPPPRPARDFIYRRMASEARGDLFVKATYLEISDQSLTCQLRRNQVLCP